MIARAFRVSLAVALGASATFAQDVRIEKDVPYLAAERTEKLDLYLPADATSTARRPAVLIIHGGGWTGGDKGAGREQNIGTTLAGAGYVCASVNYRLAKVTTEKAGVAARLEQVWPGNLHDCKNAVRFLRKHADKYRIDPERIGVIGGSAGGHLAAMVGLTKPEDGLDPDGPDSRISCQVQAIVPMYGAHDLLARAISDVDSPPSFTDAERKLLAAASPVAYASADDPPTLILHGTADKTVPVKQSELLDAALRKAQAPTRLVIVEGAPHTFHLQPKERDLRPLVIEFFDAHLKRKPTATP